MQIEIRKYIFLGMLTNTFLYCRRQNGNQRHKRNTSHLPVQKWCECQKVFPNSIKPSGYIRDRRKLPLQCAEHHPLNWML